MKNNTKDKEYKEKEYVIFDRSRCIFLTSVITRNCLEEEINNEINESTDPSDIVIYEVIDSGLEVVNKGFGIKDSNDE